MIAEALGRVPLPSAKPAQVLRISQMQPGDLLHKVTPLYPQRAKAARIQGDVVLAAVIGRDGSIHSLHVRSGHPFLAPAALEAVQQWKYRPYALNGQSVEVETQIVVTFRLDR